MLLESGLFKTVLYFYQGCNTDWAWFEISTANNKQGTFLLDVSELYVILPQWSMTHPYLLHKLDVLLMRLHSVRNPHWPMTLGLNTYYVAVMCFTGNRFVLLFPTFSRPSCLCSWQPLNRFISAVFLALHSVISWTPLVCYCNYSSLAQSWNWNISLINILIAKPYCNMWVVKFVSVRILFHITISKYFKCQETETPGIICP